MTLSDTPSKTLKYSGINIGLSGMFLRQLFHKSSSRSEKVGASIKASILHFVIWAVGAICVSAPSIIDHDSKNKSKTAIL